MHCIYKTYWETCNNRKQLIGYVIMYKKFDMFISVYKKLDMLNSVCKKLDMFISVYKKFGKP